MTGRDWIIYILSNGLENEPMFKDGKLLGFMTITEAAVKFNVGQATVRFWVMKNVIDYIEINKMIFIPTHVKDPRSVNNNG